MDDASWVMGFLDIIDPAIDSVKRLLKLEKNSLDTTVDSLRKLGGTDDKKIDEESIGNSSNGNDNEGESGFDLDAFIMQRLSLDPSKLDDLLETTRTSLNKSRRKFSRNFS